MNRRKFVNVAGNSALGLSLLGTAACSSSSEKSSAESEVTAKEILKAAASPFFQISLAQWSLHRALKAGELDNLDFAEKTKSFGIGAVEYVNQFFKDKAQDSAYLAEMNKRAKDNGVENVLIMIDGEGSLGMPDNNERQAAVEAHYKWIDAAATLGCHSIRVNAHGVGSAEDVATAAQDGLAKLSEYGATANINVIVENHGGYSSNGKWITDVIGGVDMPNCGTLPDFGNFCIERDADRNCTNEYDRYQGLKEMMAFAKGVSAKSNDFDSQGNEIHSDFTKMLQIVKDAGYKGYVGIEFEGDNVSEEEGIKLTKNLLDKVGAELA